MNKIKRDFLSVIILVFIFLLSSCSSQVKRGDGPPNFYVDESKIPNAIPKCEPRAKYGNMAYYHVFGRRYYVMKSHKNYQEFGVASWYGTKFHARRTSSGEPYNMLAMTAAHKTLPLPTYVEVTNMTNHRTVIVKVNDRGPFSSDRVIDLSYVAAKKLGMLGRGTAFVKVKAIDPLTYGRRPIFSVNKHRPARQFAPVQDVTPIRIASNQFVYLQVGAFRDRSNALKLKQRLSNLLAMPVKIACPSSAVKLYRVQIGPLKDHTTINKLTYQLKELGIQSNMISGV